MKLYLVLGAPLVRNPDGNTYGLFRGGHQDILSSFVDFADEDELQIFPKGTNHARRRIVNRKPTRKETDHE